MAGRATHGKIRLMRVLLDTNIVLDVLLNRDPWVKEATLIWRAIDDNRLEGYIVASSLTDIFYIARRLAGIDKARAAVRICLDAFQICTVNRQALEAAERLPDSDFEDNLQIACAHLESLDAIVTRDRGGFTGSTMPVLSPADLLTHLT